MHRPGRIMRRRLPALQPARSSRRSRTGFHVDGPVRQDAHAFGLSGPGRIPELLGDLVRPLPAEMLDIQAMYEDLGLNEEDVVVLAVANPKSDQYPYNQDVSEDEVKRFLEENGYTYPWRWIPRARCSRHTVCGPFPQRL